MTDRKMSMYSFDDIIAYLKWKHCNCLNSCDDCLKNCHPYMCHCKVDLVTILKELEVERKKFYGV